MGKVAKNLLTGHPNAQDALYRAEGEAAFASGEFQGPISWRDDLEGVALAPRGRLHMLPTTRARMRGCYTSDVIRTEFPFNELLPSWNIQLAEGKQSYAVHVRVGTEGEWSPWFYFGAVGPAISRPPQPKVTAAPGWGRVRIDYLVLDKPAVQFQYRVWLESPVRELLPSQAGPVVLRRFFIAYSSAMQETAGDESGRRDGRTENGAAKPVNGAAWDRVLPIPYRSQLDVPHRKLSHEICCPTCVAMILDSHGVVRPTLAVAGSALDVERGMYGVWPRAAQAAFLHGLEAWVQRFRTHDDVKQLIAAGVPVMASIRVKEGELRNARYPKTAGHLILIRGFTPEGHYVVNDPYSRGPGGEEIVYLEEDMQKVWFDKGGVGIVVRCPDAGAREQA